jgi:hypothetical protein
VYGSDWLHGHGTTARRTDARHDRREVPDYKRFHAGTLMQDKAKPGPFSGAPSPEPSGPASGGADDGRDRGLPPEPAAGPGDVNEARTLHVRLSGSADRTGEVLSGLEDIPGVEDIIQLDMDARVGRDDSSSADLPEDNATSFQETEIQVANSRAYDNVREHIATRAMDAVVVVEWLERF